MASQSQRERGAQVVVRQNSTLHWFARHGATALLVMLMLALLVIAANGWWMV